MLPVSTVFKRQSGYHSSVDYRSLWHYVGFLQNTDYRKKTASDLLPKEHYWKQLMDARLLVGKRRYEDEFKWKPGRKMEEAIVAQIFASGLE